MREVSVVEVDLSTIARNVGVLKQIVGPRCAICAVVKADAYGLGAPRVARCLVGAGVDLLAVYTPQQAAELFRAAVGGPVLLLMPVQDIGRRDDLYRALVCGRLHLAVHDPGHLDDIIHLAEHFATLIPVHLEVDTGMTRGGCNLADAPEVLRRIAEHPRLAIVGIYTQYAASDSAPELTERQTALLEGLIEEHAPLLPRGCLVHAANTCATIRDRRYHQTMVRVGQAWAGYGPESLRCGTSMAQADHLEPCVTWSSRLVQVKPVEPGTAVGYGSSWKARRPSLIGLVPVGFADGYPLSLSGADGRDRPAQVAIVREEGGPRAYAPVVGAVSMDQMTIDLTDVAADGAVPVGTRVEMISADRAAPNHLVRLAEAAGTNPYEILCRLNARIRRVYHQARAAEVVVLERAAVVAG